MWETGGEGKGGEEWTVSENHGGRDSCTGQLSNERAYSAPNAALWRREMENLPAKITSQNVEKMGLI